MFRHWKIFVFAACGLFALIFCFAALAATSDETVSVGLTVPSSATCGNGIIEGAEVCDGASLNSQTCTTKGYGCGTLSCAGDCLSFVTTGCSNSCGGGPSETDTAPPTISTVVSAPGYTTSTVTWTATDNKAVTACTFFYGTDANYGTAGTVAGTYGTSLSGLLEKTTYNFKITCRDAANNSANQTGSFTTLDSSVPPDMPPVISNITAVVGITTATISWVTNENATGQADYGLDTNYANSSSLLPLALTQLVSLSGLLPNTTYHFRITATDATGNQARSEDHTFNTRTDALGPANVSNLKLTTTSASLILSWENPSSISMPDFSGVKVLRKIGGHSTSATDGALIYTGAGETVTDSGVVRGTTYFYTVFSFDTSGNYSSGVYVSGILPVIVVEPTPEVCNNNIDDDGDGFVDCLDSDCVSYPACRLPGEEICNNSSDDDADGLIDCADPDCAATQFCRPPTTEICDDNLDNDGDGQIDCADSDCATASNCHAIPTPACRDGQDNDGDGLIDLFDPGCKDSEDTDEYNSPEIIIPPFAKLNLSDLVFAAGNRNIILQPQGNSVSGLAGAYLSVGVPARALLVAPVSMVLKINGTDNLFILNSDRQIYYADVSFPSSGGTQAYLEINYGAENGFDALNFNLASLPYGVVNGEKGSESGVTVVLYSSNNSLISMSEYGQSNPINTDPSGRYGWFVPNGDYYLSAQKSGYYDYKTQLFRVTNNVVNRNLDLIVKPKPILEEIDPNASFGENAKNVAKNLLNRTTAVSKIAARAVKEAVDNPMVEQAASETVAPAAVAVVGVGTAALVSWANLLSLLRFLFLQPLLLIGRRKREKWGQIYNSLNKLPVDLATVRLIDAATNRVVRSRVTDSKGRYIFIVNPGKYRIEAFKSNFIFPSTLLKDFREDGRHTDIYHGELIEVTEKDAVITANIPLDQLGVEATPRRLRWQRFWRRLQTVLSWSGLVITAVSLYIAPVWYMWALLGVHVALLGVFYRLAVPGRAKGWGMVYDNTSRKPISNVVARLFDSQFNKLVATEITDGRGRYSFLAGDSRYYVTYDRSGYEAHRTSDVDLTGKEEEAITMDVGLRSKREPATPPSQPPVLSEISTPKSQDEKPQDTFPQP